MDKYENPLATRYASKEMLYIFSDSYKFKSWRKLWIHLAECEKELGLSITDEQISAMKAVSNDIDFDYAAAKERELRHDVMAHIHTFGHQAPSAMPIIHLGATSAYVGDNTDVIQIREGLKLLRGRMVEIIEQFSEFAITHKALPTLGFTHFQSAQLTTVGKRATLWLQSLVSDFEELEYRLETLKCRGVKGTTGTQASFLELFNGDFEKVFKLDEMVTKAMGFEKSFAVTGQTYDRKQDSTVLQLLSNISQSAYKFAGDIRLLSHLKEIEEPFEKNQIGSSAMPYKRNPMRSERICAIARFVMSLEANGPMTASSQWFERTLDDSANKRLSIPQAFLGVDAVLLIWSNILKGILVYPKMIEGNISKELPFMASEVIIMEGVKNGGDRQGLHEKIREYAMQASYRVKVEGKSNNLIERILQDDSFKIDKEKLQVILEPKNFVGMAEIQTERYIAECVAPLLKKYIESKVEASELTI
ncbi:MAG: adenylosuccinate lyase [Fusobacteria bacterium]|nr:adenylosuccinate lyase [Fusobacteriota bacterium]